jgi:protein-arginine kinase activator protein McsA
MSQAGIVVQEDKEKAKDKGWMPDGNMENPYEQYTSSELDELINKAIENEEYEKASKIRDEIKKRKESAG